MTATFPERPIPGSGSGAWTGILPRPRGGPRNPWLARTGCPYSPNSTNLSHRANLPTGSAVGRAGNFLRWDFVGREDNGGVTRREDRR